MRGGTGELKWNPAGTAGEQVVALGPGEKKTVYQEKILGLIYYYVKNTGDKAFLNEVVDGKTILDHVIANALVLDDPSKPVALIDYGPSNSHLELRREYRYNHVSPDLNGRRHANYLRAARLAEWAGKPAPQLVERSRRAQDTAQRRLWNPKTRWFDFINGQGQPETRYTMQILKLFGSGVLDDEEEAGLLSHLNEQEFLSEHGMHSMAKGDLSYDPADVDNGGPGACTSFARRSPSGSTRPAGPKRPRTFSAGVSGGASGCRTGATRSWPSGSTIAKTRPCNARSTASPCGVHPVRHVRHRRRPRLDPGEPSAGLE